MKGAIHLNEGLAVNFERLISKRKHDEYTKNKKGEAEKLPPDVLAMNPYIRTPNHCDPEDQGFGMLKLGVTNGA